MRAFEQHFIRHIELWLSAVGVVVAFTVPTVLGSGVDFWKAVAVTSLVVGFLHGIVFWTVRRRQTGEREQTIREAREMLRGLAWSRVDGGGSVPETSQRHTFDEVNRLVEALTEERLAQWRRANWSSRRGATLPT